MTEAGEPLHQEKTEKAGRRPGAAADKDSTVDAVKEQESLTVLFEADYNGENVVKDVFGSVRLQRAKEGSVNELDLAVVAAVFPS